MTITVGGNLFTNTDAIKVTTYNLSTTATTIAASVGKNERVFFRVDLDAGTSDVNIAIRLYPAATDNTYQGIQLTRTTMANDNLLTSFFELRAPTVFLGEISAVTSAGTATVHVTEF